MESLPPRPTTLVLFIGAVAIQLASSFNAPGADPQNSRAVEGGNDQGYNLVFVSLTNTRADHLGAYGYARNTSPNIDTLAKRSLVFRNAFGHASWTLPAAVSLFTSQYPFTHGLMNREEYQPLPQSTPTLIDVLKTNGYLTAAFVGDRDYSPKFGHTVRFDHIFETTSTAPADDWKSYGVFENTMPPAREWLRQNHQKRFFLLVQGYDTHCPFMVPKEDSRFDPNYKGRIDFTKCYWTFERTKPVKRRTPSGLYQDVYLLKTKPTEGDNYEVMFFPEDVAHMIALYDGEILSADAWVGGLLDDIKNLGLEKNTIVVIFSDHGDMFGKHGRFMRGGPLRGTFYDDVLRVPFIVFHPAMEPRQVDSLLQTIDIAPTLLDLMGLPAPNSFAGKSARKAVATNEALNPMVFAGSAFTPNDKNPFFHHNSIIFSARSERWKLIWERVSYSVGMQDYFELYDVKADPQELKDLARSQPEVVTELKAAIVKWLKEIKADAYIPESK